MSEAEHVLLNAAAEFGVTLDFCDGRIATGKAPARNEYPLLQPTRRAPCILR